ncbi:MAG TPA: MarR family transcriptional regulator [Pseudonocardiaceae bacterium]|jgi:DNA-binding MarR family transcriptional regulator|nr:MarR family transcriptional regulator [Pseudonocardiaceae bacterium]
MSEPVARAAHAWAGMRTLVHDLHDRRKEVSAALDLSFFRVKVLRRLSGGPLTMRELGAKLSTDAPYVTLMVRDLEERGLVSRTAHPTDRRAKVVTLTEQGREIADQAEQILIEPPDALLALDPDDIAALDRIVATLLNKST